MWTETRLEGGAGEHRVGGREVSCRWLRGGFERGLRRSALRTFVVSFYVEMLLGAVVESIAE